MLHSERSRPRQIFTAPGLLKLDSRMCEELRLEWPALAAAISTGPPDAVASALRKAGRAVDAAQSACAWPRQLQLRRRLLLACEGRCEAAAPDYLQLLRRLHAAAAARALRDDDVSYFLHISKSGGSSVCAAPLSAASSPAA